MPRRIPRPPPAALGRADIERLLAHRAPALRLDRVVGLCTEAATIAAEWEVAVGCPDLAGHFEGAPLLPGAATIEALAQAAGLLLALRAVAPPGEARPRLAMLASVRVKLLAPVRPPATLRLEAALDGRVGSAARFSVAAVVADRVVAAGSLALAFGPSEQT